MPVNRIYQTKSELDLHSYTSNLENEHLVYRCIFLKYVSFVRAVILSSTFCLEKAIISVSTTFFANIKKHFYTKFC